MKVSPCTMKVLCKRIKIKKQDSKVLCIKIKNPKQKTRVLLKPNVQKTNFR